MIAEESFLKIAGIIGEPNRAGILWALLDGRSYTAGELALTTGMSVSGASNHLSKLLEYDLIKVESQGRHRYFSFSRPEVAYAIESLANLLERPAKRTSSQTANGVKFCRSCYDHLAGYVGVKLTEAFEDNLLIMKNGAAYSVTPEGWNWLSGLNINEREFMDIRRPLTRQCLDWSERRPHLAGKLGAVLLEKMLEKNWFKRIQFSRELLVTSKGKQEIYNRLGIAI
ncbi:helix-turn-helix domain-containing protein [Pedobacter sp. HMF7647]|uniref:Helix-turn-helix domain-containing protein n=1 Tax=Hufsiella arboris TaxID=2695275 RepID=A0A7K1Y827_9SPHI|nr:helix-turn-helix transcriptional regulator [Hufsiella arboris]MXV50735.1 helix-turn-helix domain-containing protein [Hufsiella arboris]